MILRKVWNVAIPLRAIERAAAIVGVDYGAESTEIEGYWDADGVLHITAIRTWRHELELQAQTRGLRQWNSEGGVGRSRRSS